MSTKSQSLTNTVVFLGNLKESLEKAIQYLDDVGENSKSTEAIVKFIDVGNLLLSKSNQVMESLKDSNLINEEGKITLVFATGNEYKLDSFNKFFTFNPLGFIISNLFTIEPCDNTDVAESISSFLENATLKAKSLNSDDRIVLGDDSGVVLTSVSNIYNELLSLQPTVDDRNQASIGLGDSNELVLVPGIVSKRLSTPKVLSKLSKAFGANIQATIDNSQNLSTCVKNSLQILHIISYLKDEFVGEFEDDDFSKAYAISTIAAVYKGNTIADGTGSLHGKVNFPKYQYELIYGKEITQENIIKLLTPYHGYNGIFYPNGLGCALGDIPMRDLIQFDHRSKAFEELFINILKFLGK